MLVEKPFTTDEATRHLEVRSAGLARCSPLSWALPASRACFLGLVLFVLALVPRWVTHDTAHSTIDEALWMRSSAGFAYGMNHGQLGMTLQVGNPAVTMMELAVLGQGLGDAERFSDPLTGAVFDRDITRIPGYFDALVRAKRAFALATAATVVAIALLAWRLFGPGPALIGGLLLALDPYSLAHSQLIMTDAMLSAGMAVATLCGLLRWGNGGSRWWVLAGGGASGLALLSKTPAMFLALFIPLLALLLGRSRGARVLSVDLVLWGASGLALFVALWPSMWVDPLGSIAEMIRLTSYRAGRPHPSGTFFLGQTHADPGPLYYPVAVFFRLSPAVVLGLSILVLVAWRARGSLSSRHWRVVLALLAYILSFGLFMTFGLKKLERYMLPLFPMLDLLAGLGFWLGWGLIARWRPAGLRQQSGVWRTGLNHRSLGSSLLAVIALIGLAAWPAISVYPHYLAYYNPLLGGGPVAARTIMVGEGEGLDEAARWLNARPDAAGLSVAAHSADIVQATFMGQTRELRDEVPRTADYVVIYNLHTQIGRSPKVVADYAGQRPKYVVQLNGIEYARVYSGPALDRKS